jgi:hypothetical protein
MVGVQRVTAKGQDSESAAAVEKVASFSSASGIAGGASCMSMSPYVPAGQTSCPRVEGNLGCVLNSSNACFGAMQCSFCNI